MEKSNFKGFLLLWMGQLVSAIGGGLTSFGLGVYVFNQTGSASGMAIVSLLAFLPNLIFSAPAGVLADRYDRRMLMMIGDGCSALGIIYILICMINGKAELYQICIGVFVSSVFSSLMDPAYKATVTDLLTPEEYSKANGLVGIAGNARYLISPILAGLLLTIWDIKVLLIIDICTFFLTVFSTAVVKRGLESKKMELTESFADSFKEGWKAIRENRGVFVLILVSSVMTCFMGVLQILAEPMVLCFSDSATLGTVETICACGMLVSSIFLGIRGIKKSYVKILCGSLAFAGLAMVVFGIKDSVIIMGIAGFIFFLMLPFANNCLDYLVRTNIEAEKQGRAWGLIGFLSQIGYVFAYGGAGFVADGLASSFDITVGRGAGITIMAAGILLSVVAAITYTIKSVRRLE